MLSEQVKYLTSSQWGTPSLTLPLSHTKMQDQVESLVNTADSLYFIYDGGEFIAVVNTVGACSKYINEGNLKEPVVYCADLTNQTSERVF